MNMNQLLSKLFFRLLHLLKESEQKITRNFKLQLDTRNRMNKNDSKFCYVILICSHSLIYHFIWNLENRLYTQPWRRQFHIAHEMTIIYIKRQNSDICSFFYLFLGFSIICFRFASDEWHLREAYEKWRVNCCQRCIQNPIKHPGWSFLRK